MKNRVVVTGMGALSCLGLNAAAQFQAAIEGRSGISSFALSEGSPIKTNFAASIKDELPHQLDRSTTNMFDRVAQLAWCATSEAMNQAGFGELSESQLYRSGIYWGTGFGGASTIEATYDDLFLKQKGRTRPFTVIGVMANGAAALLALQTRFQGPSITYSTACASSAHAVGEAFRQIRDGYCDRAIAGGSEAMLQSGAVNGWEALRTLATRDEERPYASCKPFSIDRSGFVLGEGAAALILESYDAAKARGATILAEIVGYGTSTDAVHVTKPDPERQARAISNALQDAGVAACDITYLNAHGTATQVGDIAETEAIKLAFDAHARSLLISSTKAIHGHVFGATGALELVITIQAQRNRIAPPTAFLDNPDPACDLNYLPKQARELPIPLAMSNSFAFGGSNVSLITRVE
jgi:3-oxoacyl-(acyl-carrier-protein) synthase